MDNRMKSVPELFERVVTRHPERIAVKTMEKQATYRELGCRSDAIAGTILEELGPESKPVMLFSDKDPVDSIAAVLGILKAGKFYIYINPTHSGVLLGRIIRKPERNSSSPTMKQRRRHRSIAMKTFV